jgi:hypothetical protein
MLTVISWCLPKMKETTLIRYHGVIVTAISSVIETGVVCED